jgi:hypothetical protein
MRKIALALVSLLMCAGPGQAQKPPILPEQDIAALANELSGETAKRNLEGLTRLHRQRGSKAFHESAELVAQKLRAYGLSDVAILTFPADGKVFYGTQRSRPAWEAEFAELWERGAASDACSSEKAILDQRMDVKNPKEEEQLKKHFEQIYQDCRRVMEEGKRLASYDAEPVTLAEDSETADVTAELVDVGAGMKESDYSGKSVKGKIVLVSAQPGAVQDLAVGKFGAVGIVSYAQNQKTAWWGEDENLIRWGHLETFSEHKTFGFMVSLKTARAMRERLAKGEKITLHAVVKAEQHAGNYEVVTATIPGTDPKVKDEEIAFSCHLDHQRPGANDNASGCVTILEVARTLQKLINEKKIAPPGRTIRFIFPPEVEGTMALLNGKPEFAKRIEAVIHMDMVGGGPETKAVFHVTRGPMSLPSFVQEIAWVFANWLNDQSYRFAAGLRSDYPMVAPEGGKEPLRAEYTAYTMGSDHDIYQDSSFKIPAIYLNDWPDRYIHTNFDSAANIDPTKLKRAGFIGAASALFLAGTADEATNFGMGLSALMMFPTSSQRRKLDLAERISQATQEKDTMRRVYDEYEAEWDLRPGPESQIQMVEDALKPQPLPKDAPPEAALVFRRTKEPKGPLALFEYDYFEDHAKKKGISEPKLLSYEGLWGDGGEYAYEVLNFANGKRNAQEIRDAVTTEYGPVPLEMVVEYLKALEKIGIVEEVK